MKRLLLTVLVIFVGLSFSLANCAYAGKARVVVTEKDEDKDGKKAYLGIYMSDVSDEIIEDKEYPYNKGVLVMEVIDDSPAEEAGLRAGDIIYIFAGDKVDDTKNLSRLVNGKTPGEKVEIVFFRGGNRKRTNANLTGKKNDSYTVQYNWEEYAEKMGKMGERINRSIGGVINKYFDGNTIEGLELSDLDEDIARYFDVEKDDGILVTGISGESPAKEAGIKSGDIIVEINGEEIKSVEDYNEILGKCDKEFKLVVVRKKKKIEFQFKPEDLERKYFGLHNKRIYKFDIPEDDERFHIITRKGIDMENRLKKMEPLHKELVIIQEETGKCLKKNLEDIQNKVKEMEKRLKELEDKKN